MARSKEETLMTTPTIIRTDDEYREAHARYSAASKGVIRARREGRHRLAARLAQELKPLEDALTLYDATNGRR